MPVNLEYVYNKIMFAEKLESKMNVLQTNINDDEAYTEEEKIMLESIWMTFSASTILIFH